MAKREVAQQRPSSNEIRRIMLQYFYDRNKNATSARGKKGSHSWPTSTQSNHN